MEHELTDALHKFVKDYAFQRFDVQFQEKQMGLNEVQPEPAAVTSDEFFDALSERIKDTASGFQKRADESGIATSLSSGGKTLAEFKPKGKVH